MYNLSDWDLLIPKLCTLIVFHKKHFENIIDHFQYNSLENTITTALRKCEQMPVITFFFKYLSLQDNFEKF